MRGWIWADFFWFSVELYRFFIGLLEDSAILKVLGLTEKRFRHVSLGFSFKRLQVWNVEFQGRSGLMRKRLRYLFWAFLQIGSVFDWRFGLMDFIFFPFFFFVGVWILRRWFRQCSC